MWPENGADNSQSCRAEVKAQKFHFPLGWIKGESYLLPRPKVMGHKLYSLLAVPVTDAGISFDMTTGSRTVLRFRQSYPVDVASYFRHGIASGREGRSSFSYAHV
jgi:hypothetical protein